MLADSAVCRLINSPWSSGVLASVHSPTKRRAQAMKRSDAISVPAVIVNTTHGLISIEVNLLHLFAMGNASLPAVLFKLRLPHALPHIFVGLKIAAGASVVGALVGETFAGSSALGAGGLGYSAVYALSQLAIPYLFALILTSSLLGLAFFLLVTTLERLTVGHWSESLIVERID